MAVGLEPRRIDFQSVRSGWKPNVVTKSHTGTWHLRPTSTPATESRPLSSKSRLQEYANRPWRPVIAPTLSTGTAGTFLCRRGPRPCTPLVLGVCHGAVQSIIYTYVSYSSHRELASPAGVRSAVMCVCQRAVQSIRRSSEATSDGQIDHGQVKKPAFPGKNRSHGQTRHLAI